MNNTHNHAGGRRQTRETWWSTVYADLPRKRVCYTFLDTGVGIFRSIRIRGLRKAYHLIGIQNDADILRDILKGKVESSTGLSYRGKGLPAIFRLSQAVEVAKNLKIVSNGLYADVAKRELPDILATEFKGTLYTGKLSKRQ